MIDSPLPFALIGAGPMGLAMARNLQRLDLPFEGFEVHADVGGLWDIDGPRSSMYQSAHLISSKRMTEFADFPFPDSAPDYPNHRQVRDYFRAYADHFGLRQCFRFGVEVMQARRRQEGGFELSWRTSEGRLESGVYRGLMIATGTFSEPRMPEIAGTFSGRLVHSSAYKTADLFDGARVLVIGAGNSGCDLAVDAVHRARKVSMSVRRGYHFVPKYLFGRPADTLGGRMKLPRPIKQRLERILLSWFSPDPTRFGFPAPDYRLYEVHPIVNSLLLYHLGHGDLDVKPDVERFEGDTVRFVDGSSETYDLVVCATGYRLHYPFIDHSELNWRGQAPHLYLNCFHPEQDDLFVLGMVEAAGLGWQARYEQAELVARYVEGSAANEGRGSAAAAEFRALKREPFPAMDGGFGYLPLERMAFYVHKETYRTAVRRHLEDFSRKSSRKSSK